MYTERALATPTTDSCWQT